MEKISDIIKNTINQSGKITINPYGLNYIDGNLSLLHQEYNVYKAVINFDNIIEYNYLNSGNYDILFLFDNSQYYVYDVIIQLKNFIVKKYYKSVLISNVAKADIDNVLNNISIFLSNKVNQFPTINIFNQMSLGLYSNDIIIFSDYILDNIGLTI